MRRRVMWPLGLFVVLIGSASHTAVNPQTLAPIIYTIKITKPDSHEVEIEAVFPTAGRPSIDIMMAVWSPGFYRVQDYAKQVEDLRRDRLTGRCSKSSIPRRTAGRSRPAAGPRSWCPIVSSASRFRSRPTMWAMTLGFSTARQRSLPWSKRLDVRMRSGSSYQRIGSGR